MLDSYSTFSGDLTSIPFQNYGGGFVFVFVLHVLLMIVGDSLLNVIESKAIRRKNKVRSCIQINLGLKQKALEKKKNLFKLINCIQDLVTV